MEGTILSNLAGVTLSTNWKIPGTGEKGTIQNTDSGDTGYLRTNGNIAAGSAVEEMALVANDDGQLWERSTDDDLGYFILLNPKSGKVLTGANTPNILTIEGNGRLLC